MDKNTILVMEAGEELDGLVAAEVMGEPMPEFTPENALELQLAGSPVKSPKGNWLCLCRYSGGDIPIWRPLPYSTDISAAWPVVERMRHPFRYFGLQTIIKDSKWLWEANIRGSVAICENAPEAICKAALITRLELEGAI